jgi:hypothetical protein
VKETKSNDEEVQNREDALNEQAFVIVANRLSFVEERILHNWTYSLSKEGRISEHSTIILKDRLRFFAFFVFLVVF